MSQPNEVQASPKKRRRRLLAIFGFIAIVALSLGLVTYSSLNPSLNLAQTKTFNTCQQTSTIFSNTSTTTTTINNCQQNQITGPAPLGGVTVVSSTASQASTAATTAVTFVVTSASTHEYHPKLSNGEGNIALPSLNIGDPPALASPTSISGAVTILYGDGSPAVLSANQVTLNLCTASCVPVTATLKRTSTGTYTYTFTPPSLTGTVTIYLASGSLADEWGRIFPSVDTQIGTYTFAPTTTTGTSQQERSAPPAGTPPAPLTQQAVNTNQNPPTATPVKALLLTLSALTVAGCLLVLPKRRRSKKEEDSAP